MQYPDFFNQIESISLYDPLAETLGSVEDGIIKFHYSDSVKNAGHSCPTVAGAYLMTSRALKALFPDDMPVRGMIKVEFSESVEDGVAGVIANVISAITGATSKSGFKGLNGNFARHSLLFYNSPVQSSARFTRTDNDDSVDVFYNPEPVAADADLFPLLQKILHNKATNQERKTFGFLWQDRVKRILIDSADSVIKLQKPA